MRFAHWLPTIFLFACSLLSAQQVMRVVSSVPLPDAWNRIDYARPSCGPKGDFIARQMADPTELPHELVHIDAKGALLGQIELHQIGGFENGTIDDAALDSRGEIVLLVRKVRSSRPTRVDDEGRPRGMSFSMELASWVLTVDDSARLLSKFSFDQRIVAGLQFALFHSGNVLVPGRISQHGEPAEFGAAIFSPAGGVLAIKRLPL